MKTFNVPRLRRLVARAWAGRATEIDDVAARQWVIGKGGTLTCPPAHHPPGAVDKIRQLSPYRTWPQEERMLRGGDLACMPTRAFTLRNVQVVDSHLYCGSYERHVGVGEPALWLPRVPREPDVAHGTLVSTVTGTQYFGCLLLDDLPLELLAVPGSRPVSMLSRPSGHEADYRSLLGLQPKHVLRRAHIRELDIYVDPACNDTKTERYRTLRAHLRENLGDAPGAERLYIRRGLSGQRRVMTNEAELEAALVAEGFTVIDPMQLTAQEIARQSLGARVVVSIEGSQLSHAQYTMADDAALIVLQPPDRFCLQYKEFTDALGMQFGFVVCEPGPEGFVVDIPELLRLIERMGV